MDPVSCADRGITWEQAGSPTPSGESTVTAASGWGPLLYSLQNWIAQLVRLNHMELQWDGKNLSTRKATYCGDRLGWAHTHGMLHTRTFEEFYLCRECLNVQFLACTLVPPSKKALPLDSADCIRPLVHDCSLCFYLLRPSLLSKKLILCCIWNLPSSVDFT